MPGPLRLLLVEDSNEDALMLERELVKVGYVPVVTRVWKPADLEAALREPWDIVISDWAMPNFTGLDAYRIVRKHDPDLPFLIVSGTIDEDVAVDALRAGVQDFMSKGRFARLAPAIERTRRDAEIHRRQRLADQELELRRAEVVRSERLLRIVLDSVPDAVVVADASRQIVACNAAATDLLGVKHGAPALYQVFRPDKVTRLGGNEQVLPRVLRGDAVDHEEQFVRPPGASDGLVMSVSARPLRDESGITGAVVVYRDMSGERAAQEQLMVSDRMASVGMLAAGVAHEINNPLACVLANLELLDSALTDPAEAVPADERKEMLDDARTAADRVRQIVRDLKIFSRHEDAQDGAVDLRRTLESTLRMAWNEIRHRARLEKDLVETPPVRGSESRLGQVFLNLVVNAAQAIPEGNAERNTIRVRTRVDDPEVVVVEVADTGSGMSPDVKRHLFSPFFTTKPPGMGSGLGLAISHRIVTSLGGSIAVDSEPGRGTTFYVTLPIAEEQPSEPVRRSRTVRTTRRARILVVDDEPMITSALRRALSAEHDVFTTNQASQALERVQAGEHFDVILCDLMMPQMTGMELHAELQAISPELAARLIFLTGGAFTVAGRHFLDQVANQRVEKPFDARHLRALIADRVR
jgi:PAS domain S-box-containing protein